MFEHRLTDFEERLPKTTRNDLARRLAAFSSGVNQLLFSNGVPIDIDSFVEPAIPGKIPLNIVYLNTIQDEAQKQYFVQELSRELYDWMLTQQPADGELKLLFFMDEVAPYLPPHPRNPPAKTSSNSFSNKQENMVLLVYWQHRTFPMWITRFSLKPIRHSLDDSPNHKMLRRYVICSKRVGRSRPSRPITDAWTRTIPNGRS